MHSSIPHRNICLTVGALLSCVPACRGSERGIAAPEEYSAARMLALWEARTSGRNVALGRPVTFTPTPDYHLTVKEGTDPDDLVDGELCTRTDQAIWWEPKAVGWGRSHGPLKTIIVDLGAETPVSHVLWRVTAGCAKRNFHGPKRVRLYGGTDGIRVHLIRERLRWSTDTAVEDAYRMPNIGPPEQGDRVYVFPLQINADGYRMRYVVLEFEMDGAWLASDELAVIGDPNEGRPMDALPAHRLQTKDVWLRSDEEVYPLPSDLSLPLWLRQRDLRPGGESQAVQYEFRVPKGLSLAGPPYYKRSEGDDGTALFRYPRGGNSNRIGPFFVSGALAAPVVLHLRSVGDGATPQPWQSVTFRPAALPKPFRLTQLSAGIGWFVDREQLLWPAFPEAYARLGFNTVPTFPRGWGMQALGREVDPAELRESDAPHLLTEKGRRLQSLRDSGYRIVYMESPIHVVNWRHPEAASEYKCQLPTGTPREPTFCPTYRGEYFQNEVRRIADHVRQIGPHDLVLWDWEIAGSGQWLGTSCTRCQTAFRHSGDASWTEFVKGQTLGIIDALHRAVRDACREHGWQTPAFGMYNHDAVEVYSGLFDFARDGRMDVQSPSLYVGDDPAAVHNRIRRARRASPAPILPWLTTGTYGYVSPVSARLMVWEAFLNGAWGVTYFSFADMNPAHLVEICRALASIASVEDIVAHGQPCHADFQVTPSEGLRHSAVRLGNRAALLLVNTADSPRSALWHFGQTGSEGRASIPAGDAVLLQVDL